MRQSKLLGLLPWLATASPIVEQHDRTQVDSISNANHIFNSIHDSMRQFGSSLNHNGMGVFIATVPEGTEFYHGTGSQYRINGTEWLAFEPEHAMIFARSRGPGGPGGPGRRPGGGPPDEGPHEDYEDEDEEEDGHPHGPPHHEPDRYRNNKTYPGHPREGHPGGNGTHHGPPGHKGPGKKPQGPPCHEDREKKPHGPPGREGPGKKPNRPPGHEDPKKQPHGPPGHHDEDKPHGPPPGSPSREHPGHHDGDKPLGPPRGPPPGEKHGHDNGDKSRGPPHRPPPDKHSDHEDERQPHHPQDRPAKGKHPKGDKDKHHAKDGKKEKHDCKKDKNNSKQDKKEKHNSMQEDHYAKKELRSDKEDNAPLEDIYDAKNNSPWPRAYKDRKQEEGPRGIIGAIGRLIGHHQEPLSDDTPIEETPPPPQEEGEQRYGYLHTYRTKHPLRLIYLDGQSAAKSNKGTLDVQDLILRNHTSADGDRGRGMMGEKERADDLCQLIHTEYADRVDGILRMEGGFEIILCDFAKDLDQVRILPAKASGMGPGGGDADHFNYWEAISARYFDIGANRVRLDFESFITLFAYPSAIYFDETNRPRVKNDTAEMQIVRQDIKKVVLEPSDNPNATAAVNWQDITDLIVTRYAERIAYMASGELSTLAALTSEIERALRPFIDYSNRNATLEAERCATQFWPRAAAIEPIGVAGHAIRKTYQTLCSALAFAGQESDYDRALEAVRQLKSHLAWTTWKKCTACAPHEICLVPVWPMGSKEDFEQPPCVSSATIGERHGDYWNGGFGGPGGRRGRDDKKDGQESEEKRHGKGHKQDKMGKKHNEEKEQEVIER